MFLTRIRPIFYFVAAVLAMVILGLAPPVVRIFSWPWTLLGIAPALVGVTLNLMADAATMQQKNPLGPSQEPTTLVTEGVFQVSRHPMYLGMTLMLLGFAMLSGALSSFVIVAGFAILMELVFMRREERALDRTYRESWRQYERNVRRWV